MVIDLMNRMIKIYVRDKWDKAAQTLNKAFLRVKYVFKILLSSLSCDFLIRSARKIPNHNIWQIEISEIMKVPLGAFQVSVP